MARFLESLRNREIGDQGGRTVLGLNRQTVVRGINLFLLVLAFLAVGSLLAEYGFDLSPDWQEAAQLANVIVLYGFVGQGLLKLVLAQDRLAHLRSRWVELSILLIVLLHLLFPGQVAKSLLAINPLLGPEALARIYIVLTQLFIVLALIPPALRASRRIMTLNIQPSMLIFLSFLFLIIVGTLLLSLPRATATKPLSFIDALFTATSAVCVTGLIVVDTATYFTPLGHTILMILIQVGGLGIMTLTTFFAYVIGRGSQLKEYSALQTLIGEENLGKIRQTIFQIALVTFGLEALGSFLLYKTLDGAMFGSDGNKIFFSVFHSISAFCNAGFTLTSENLSNPFLRSNLGVLGTVMFLIILGGLGFPVLSNLGSFLIPRGKSSAKRRLSVHSKLVLLMSSLLILVGALGILLLENSNTMKEISFGQRILQSLFHSVSARTAGFNALDVGALAVPTLFLITVLMWIGASPGSTGGGVKTTTAALALLNIHAIASGKNKIQVFRKHISEVSIVRAFSTVLLSFFFLAVALFCLLLSEKAPLDQLLFEVVSAVGTVGYSTGITAHLSSVGKIVIIVSMFAGRVGLLAVAIALTRRRVEGRYEYTEEHVLVT
jgi:trk system potassium uptake protein TrkH